MRAKVSLKQIAEQCGFSVPLVSSVLAGKVGANRCSRETFETITRCAQELGYTPNLLAKAIVTGKPPIVLFSIHEAGNQQREMPDFYLNDIIFGGSRQLTDAGLYALYMPYSDSAEQLEQIRKLAGAGMIGGVFANIADPGVPLPLYQYLADLQLPTLYLGFPQSPDTYAVGIDNSVLESVLDRYAREHGYSRRLQLFAHRDETPMFCFPDEREVSYDEIADPRTMIFLPGINRYNIFARRFPELCGDRIVLIEDTRFQPDLSAPSILFPSLHPQAIAIACDLLHRWIADGTHPPEHLHVIHRTDANIRFLNERKRI